MSTAEPDLITKSARVYLDLEPEDVPPHPGDEWTRFVCISDTHSMNVPTPAGDVLLHSGDISHGRVQDIKSMFAWLRTLPHEKKVIIAGNHDLCLDVGWQSRVSGVARLSYDSDAARDIVRSPEIREAGIYYLEHEQLELEMANKKVWKIYGSPAAPRYALKGAFQYKNKEGGAAIYSRIPPDTEILLTHTPSHRTLDRTRNNVHAGCPILAARLQGLTSCRLHACGHIHEAYGAEIGPGDRISVNAAVVEHNQPVVVDLKNDEGLTVCDWTVKPPRDSCHFGESV